MLGSTRELYPRASSLTPPEQCGRCTAEDALVLPRYAEDGEECIFCFSCHGYLIGPEGRRLCNCREPTPLPPRLAEKARVLDKMRDALAERYRRRWFKVLLPILQDAGEDEARGVWAALWLPAREQAARKLAEQGLS